MPPFRQTGRTILAPPRLRCVVPNGSFSRLDLPRQIVSKWRKGFFHVWLCVMRCLDEDQFAIRPIRRSFVFGPSRRSLKAAQLVTEPRPNSITLGLCFTSSDLRPDEATRSVLVELSESKVLRRELRQVERPLTHEP